MKFSNLVMLAAVLMCFSTNSFAGVLDEVLFGAKAKPKYESLPPAKVYSEDEFKALADSPKLVVLVSKYHQTATENEVVFIEKYQKKAGKSGAEGLFITNSRTVKAGTTFSKMKVKQQTVSAESFRLEEPTL